MKHPLSDDSNSQQTFIPFTMIEPIIQFFERLVTEFTWKRLMLLLSVVFISLVSLTFFEIYTGYFRLGRIEKASNLLDKLVAQSEIIKPSAPEGILKIHDALIGDLQQYASGEATSFAAPVWLIKACAASVPWFLVALIMFFATTGEYRTILGGILLVATPFIFIGAILPDFNPPWINYILYPIASCIIVMIPLSIYGNRKNRSNVSEIAIDG